MTARSQPPRRARRPALRALPARLLALATVFLLVAAARGCSAVGDFCSSDDDCASGLRCAIRAEASRGVCTYPPGAPDVGMSTDGQGGRDLGTGTPESSHDAGLPDGSPDRGPGDSAADAAPDTPQRAEASPDRGPG